MNSLKDRLSIINRSPLWAILPDRLAPLVLSLVTGHGLAVEWEAAKPYSLGPPKARVAVIPVQGVLTKDGPAWLGSSYDSIVNAAETAVQDASVKRVVLAVDSPGGEFTGLPETAAALASFSKVKPITAMVEGMAASAAYWIASQATDVNLTPSGEVGSVGIRMMHADVSEMVKNAGIKITELYSGDFKTEWSPFQPLTDAAKEDMQSRLVGAHTQFIDDVASGRGNRASEDIKSRRYGEGRMFSSDSAMEHGLVDRVQTPREFYQSLIPAQEDTDRSGLRRARVALSPAWRPRPQ